jgi:hypothetical protein
VLPAGTTRSPASPAPSAVSPSGTVCTGSTLPRSLTTRPGFPSRWGSNGASAAGREESGVGPIGYEVRAVRPPAGAGFGATAAGT